MLFSTATLTLLTTAVTASYVLQDDYSTNSFADMFDFFTDNDPTNGYVNYIDYNTAQSSGLYKLENGQVYMGVDSTNTASGRGRDSIRIASKNTYQHGLVILDLAHMPAGACGTWPAFWMLGEDWPYNGEIDIIEGVSAQTSNNMAMHTDAGCTITNTGAFSGSLETANCDVNAAGQATNAGCSIRSADDSSFGSGFNSNGGGVYATEWTSEAVSIWFFSRDAIPSDITSGNPDPSGWGLPQGQFTGGCDIDDKVRNQQLVFDVTFCGDWAGGVWSTDSTCSAKASTCQDFVQNNPSAFQDTYWLINSLKVYSENGAEPSATQTSAIVTTVATSAGTDTGVPAATSVTTFVTLTSGLSTYTPEPTTITLSTDTPAAEPTAAVTTAPAAVTQYTTAVVTTAAAETSAAAGGGWSGGSSNNGGWSGRGSGGGWSGRGGGGWGH